MNLFGKIIQGAIDTALLPVQVVKDAATLGGVLTENGETYTGEKLRKLKRKVEEIYEALDD
jgi:hypothetical protein